MPNPSPDFDVVDPTGAASWDQRVSSYPGATFFHTGAWAGVLADTYSLRPCYLCWRTPSTPQGRHHILPAFETRPFGRGRRGECLPFSDECGPLIAPSTGENARREGDPDMADLLSRAGKRFGWTTFECRGGREWFGGVPWYRRFRGHCLPLSAGSEAVYRTLDRSVRKKIRQAQSHGLSVQHGQSFACMETYYRLHCRTRKRLGVPPQPCRFFESIAERVMGAGLGFVTLVFKGAEAVAGAVFLRHGGQAVCKFSASESWAGPLRPNNLLFWSAIQRLCDEGVAHLDFGRTDWSHEGLRQFKLAWGCVEREIYYLRYRIDAGCFDGPRPESAGMFGLLATRIFRHLPVPCLRLAGRVLYPWMV